MPLPRAVPSFRWHVPAEFNIAEVCGRRWAAESSRIALHYRGRVRQHAPSFTYAALMPMPTGCRTRSPRLASARRPRGDRAAAACRDRDRPPGRLPDGRGGDAAVDSVRPRRARLPLHDSAAGWRSAIHRRRVAAGLRTQCPRSHLVIVGRTAPTARHDWSALLARAADRFAPVDAGRDPAVLIYTSGTTGPPKGALIPHSALIGNLPGFVASQNWFPRAVTCSGRRPTGPGPAA
jgi:acetyl-CoA synthetase